MRHRAFTLAEVMFAVLLLGIGLIAIASLFPIAGTIQRDTVDKVVAMNVGRSAEAVMLGKQIPASTFGASPSSTLARIPNLNTYLPAADRCYPSLTPAQIAASDYSQVKHYWYPLYRKDTAKGYQFVVFVVRRMSNDFTAPSDKSDIDNGTFIAQSGASLAGDIVAQTTGALSQATADNSAAASAWRVVSSGSTSRFLHVIVVGGGAVR